MMVGPLVLLLGAAAVVGSPTRQSSSSGVEEQGELRRPLPPAAARGERDTAAAAAAVLQRYVKGAAGTAASIKTDDNGRAEAAPRATPSPGRPNFVWCAFASRGRISCPHTKMILCVPPSHASWCEVFKRRSERVRQNKITFLMTDSTPARPVVHRRPHGATHRPCC
jgi:hypothetical protein